MSSHDLSSPQFDSSQLSSDSSFSDSMGYMKSPLVSYSTLMLSKEMNSYFKHYAWLYISLDIGGGGVGVALGYFREMGGGGESQVSLYDVIRGGYSLNVNFTLESYN